MKWFIINELMKLYKADYKCPLVHWKYVIDYRFVCYL